jgi:pilus assembly protein CpaB
VTNKLALVVAVVLGVLSILGVRFYVEKIKVAYDTKNAPVDVPVASRDLKMGDTVQKGDIAIAQIPHVVIDALGGSHFLANETDKFEGGKVVVPFIKQGQVFQQYHFRIQRSNSKLTLPAEYRAVTITTSITSGLCGMLRPGDKVDVVATEAFKDVGIATGFAGGKKDLRVTSTILQGVIILAVDNFTDADVQSPDYTTVTLRLHPDEVNRLMYVVDNASPYHLVKVEDTTAPSSAVNAVFSDTEWDKAETEVRTFFNTKNRHQPGPK